MEPNGNKTWTSLLQTENGNRCVNRFSQQLPKASALSRLYRLDDSVPGLCLRLKIKLTEASGKFPIDHVAWFHPKLDPHLQQPSQDEECNCRLLVRGATLNLSRGESVQPSLIPVRRLWGDATRSSQSICRIPGQAVGCARACQLSSCQLPSPSVSEDDIWIKTKTKKKAVKEPSASTQTNIVMPGLMKPWCVYLYQPWLSGKHSCQLHTGSRSLKPSLRLSTKQSKAQKYFLENPCRFI